MKRKFFMAFAFIFIIFCMSNVKAYTNDGIINEKHVMYYTMIQKNVGNDIWKYMQINIYNAGEDVLFQIGEEHKERADIAIQNRYYNEKILSVLENGFGKVSYKEAGVLDDDEVYVATHLALNFAYSGKPFDEFDNCYRASINLKGKDKENADNIIKAAKNMLLSTNTYLDSSSLQKIGEYAEDDAEKNYFSQSFELNMKNRKLKNYSLSLTEENGYSGIEFLIKNENGKFKLLVPKDKADETFSVNVNVDFDYDVDRLYLADDGIETFVVLSTKTESDSLSDIVCNVKKADEDEAKTDGPNENIPPVSEDKADNQDSLKGDVIDTEIPKKDEITEANKNKDNNGEIIKEDTNKSEANNDNITTEIPKVPDKTREEVISDANDNVIPNTNESEKHKDDAVSSERNERENYTKTTNEASFVRNGVEHKESYEIRNVLPRTGNDFFPYKIYLLNFLISKIFFDLYNIKKHRLLF